MMRVLPSALAAGICLSACASSDDRALTRLHEAEAKADQAGEAFDRLYDEYMRIEPTCDAGQPCTIVLDALRKKANEVYAQYQRAEREVDRAQRDLAYAEAAAQERSARIGAALSASGAYLQNMQPRAPITCTTSNTTIPTTTCW